MDQNQNITQIDLSTTSFMVGKVAHMHKMVLRSIIDWYDLSVQCCRTSLERLAESAGMSLTTYRTHLVQIQASGWISRKDESGSPRPGTSTIRWNLNIPKIKADLEPLLRQQSEEHRRKRPKYTRAQKTAMDARKASELARLRAENELLAARVKQLEALIPVATPTQTPRKFNLDTAEKI